MNTIQITSGQSVSVRVEDVNLATDIYYNADQGTAGTCPLNTATYCPSTTLFTSAAVTGNTFININTYVNPMFGTFQYCP